MKKSTIIVISIICLIVIAVICMYNSMVFSEEQLAYTLYDINISIEEKEKITQDLIATVKKYANREKRVIKQVTNAREELVNASSVKEKAEANDELTIALNDLFIVVEKYPKLKKDKKLVQLSKELVEVEEKMILKIEYYNFCAKRINTLIKKFPSSLLANMYNFEFIPVFEIDEVSTWVDKVDFE